MTTQDTPVDTSPGSAMTRYLTRDSIAILAPDFVGTRPYARPMTTFALTTVHGPSWDASRQIREQQAWDEHAAFMDRLVDDGFVILGGPMGDGERALLIVEATDAQEAETRMADDPWASMGLLRIGALEPWTIWLDGRQNSSSSSSVGQNLSGTM